MRDKRKLTEELIKHLPNNASITVDDVYPVWWYNLRSEGGLRLTKQGYQVFCEQLELEHWAQAIDIKDIDLRLVLDLDKRLQNPYYIEFDKKIPTRLIFFGSKEAVLARLYGNVRKFINRYRY